VESSSSRVGVESCGNVKFPGGKGLLMTILIGPVY